METLTVAIISAIVALLSAGLSIFGQIRIKNIEANLEHKKHMRDKAEKAEIIISKYRDPLLNAAFDLQSRLFNILEKNLLFLYVVAGTEREKLYVVENTLYLFAQYFGWTEIIRREIQFLDLGDDRKTRELSGIQGSIRSLFVSDEFGPEFMVFYGEQRAIGEQMIVGDREDLTCLGYAAFTQIDDRFQKWFSPLKNDLDQLSVDGAFGAKRLARIQNALIDLVDFLDSNYVRFPEPQRQRVDFEYYEHLSKELCLLYPTGND